ncbi:DUF1292 domain-containing protein [Lactovum miscens]|uniref:UPF0473 protein HNQ37_000697 n=1 Tax=Lactovum miscens TaxID=190387 RepID=A0A841C9D9_9LACT|nr:DUF1292 domain-containing protein [Lactovum miscens]MBB5887820.1 uncharacterized protein YrzB (UPF0473 family) [Lactovum miscens]
MTEHTHDHDQELEDEERLITLIDDEGNEVLFEVVLTIDGKEEFGKSYVLLLPAGLEDDEDAEISVYSFTQNEDGTEGNLTPIPEDAEDEWAMIEDVFNQFQEEVEEED